MLQPEIVLGFIGQHTLKSEESIFFFFANTDSSDTL